MVGCAASITIQVFDCLSLAANTMARPENYLFGSFWAILTPSMISDDLLFSEFSMRKRIRMLWDPQSKWKVMTMSYGRTPACLLALILAPLIDSILSMAADETNSFRSVCCFLLCGGSSTHLVLRVYRYLKPSS